MTIHSYRLAMAYLDIIETELNKIAKAVGHSSYSEWNANEKVC